MNLQARRISGSTFTAEDKLSIQLNTDSEVADLVVHSIEVVSGVAVTHGGGAIAGDYLHYKSNETDADVDGVIDYSTSEMNVVQTAQGTSVIKVICSITTQSQVSVHNTDSIAYDDRATDAGVTDELPNGTDGAFTEVAPTITPTVLKTGDITLEWSDDSFVQTWSSQK